MVVGVSTLGGTDIKQTELLKKIAVGVGGMAISCMAVDEVTSYVDKQFQNNRRPDQRHLAEGRTKKETVEEVGV